MAGGFSLKDQLFNRDSIAQLADEYAAALPGFDAARFQGEVLSGLPSRELMERLDWIADCLESRLAPDFPTMADQLEAAMPPPLDPSRRDDDFGQFIHAVPGILAVRHGLEAHRDRALDLIHAATRRFSMEYYIRPFLNRWPEETLVRLRTWATDPNYHVRRLVSEGTRPRLPWGKAVRITTDQTMPLLDILYADPTRFVTRSVANHLNDIAKDDPQVVLDAVARWRKAGRQDAAELDWMSRHALRTLVKQGHAGALETLGYRTDCDVSAELVLHTPRVVMGEAVKFEAVLKAPEALPVIVDYRLWFIKADGQSTPKVFKLKTTRLQKGKPLTLPKTHRLRSDATTYRLCAGEHRIELQVNGKVLAEARFDLVPA